MSISEGSVKKLPSIPGRSRSLAPGTTSSGTATPDNRVVINVGGIRYETYKSTLKNIPDTRLSWLTETANQNAEFNPDTGEYFFDRNPGMFNMILNYYRTGRLHAPTDVCGPVFEEELTFWGIDETQIEACCWSQYRTHREAEQTLAELNAGDGDSSDGEQMESVASRFGIEEIEHARESRWERIRPKVWTMLEEPQTSRAAQVIAAVSLLFVLLSVGSLCLETHVNFRVPINASEPMNWNWTVYQKNVKSRPHPALEYIEFVCMGYFTTELVTRFVFCPSKLAFFRDPMNWIDIFSVLPFYIEKIAVAADSTLQSTGALQILKTIRLIRIFRIFKLAKHFIGLKILVRSIKASAKELLLLIVFLCVNVLIFAALVYYAEAVEESDVNSFKNIPIGFWWAVVTMTTLGYGDMIPRTALGYLVGSFCAIAGVLVLALPVPVIVNNFAVYYSHAQAKLKLPKKKKKVLVGAADMLKTQLTLPSDIDEELDGSPDPRCLSPSGSLDSATSIKNVAGRPSHGSADSGINTNGSNEGISRSSGISVTFTDDVTSPRKQPEEPLFGRSASMKSRSSNISVVFTDEINESPVPRHRPPLAPPIRDRESPARIIKKNSVGPAPTDRHSTDGVNNRHMSMRAFNPRARRGSLLPRTKSMSHMKV